METKIEHYAQVYPHHGEALETLRSILTFQADVAAKIEPGPRIALDIAHARWQVGEPLLSRELLSTSHPLLHDALVALRAALSRSVKAQTTLDRLLASGYVDSTATESFLGDLSRNGAAHIRQVAAALPADPDLLALLLHTAIAPFYQRQAVPYRPWLDTFVWRRGDCPMCGSEPSMARLARDDGRRILVCSLCRSEWPFDRLRCPFCEAAPSGHPLPQFRHFTVEGDPAHRVDCCERCRRYLKTVDERVLAYGVDLRAEEIVTAHLDRLAHEQGYA